MQNKILIPKFNWTKLKIKENIVHNLQMLNFIKNFQ